ncbi:MarR family winged helix-turn-helix transcriptional regulator [Stackebrandtia nassauensis]|uniref:Transcriptional regulator, MarR family n=1 Tax=Stackebrandtia nassauensis (strain DSM 44728 / CIP 108903 / NRRL B-16338 / NBRC 102104 / LLR-40K-21) TaxID=446470 RepID=D3QBM2_STANL|nr:MarR family transcriptional regulator [Stackebrandtia nassauensis]ADD42904.1 transcriptional regulator, MarR family [Stackebrandtia nassauensis DSM 44728]
MNDSVDTGILDRLLHIAVVIQQDMAATFSGTGLNPARVHLLWVLRERQPQTQQALAAALNVTPANVTGLVDALEKHGFVERRRHPEDRRAILVALTERGADTMRAMARDRELFATALVEDLDGDERRRLHDALGQVAERMEDLTRPMRESKGEA